MKTKTLIVSGAACLALAVAAPVSAAPSDSLPPVPEGQALAPEVVPGAGLSGVAGSQATIRHVVIGKGSIGTAQFRIHLGSAAHTVVYVDPARRISFRALDVASLRFVGNKATLHGVGLVNDKRVGFSAVAVHNALPGVDTLRIAWEHRAGLGGRVATGSVFIR